MTRYLTVVGRLVLGAVFLYAAYTKLRQPWLLFAMSIDAYKLLPEQGVLFLARTIPWLELGLGILLLAGFGLRYAATFSSVLLLTFFAVMVRAYAKGMGIDCGCFGVGEALGPRTLVRDGLLVALSIALAVGAFRVSRQQTTRSL